MRWAMLLGAVLLLTSPLAGCLGDEQLDPTDDVDEANRTPDGDDATHGGDGQPANVSDTTANASSEPAGDAAADADGPVVEDRPLTVLAHLDTGINPYHEIFRDDSELAHAHPSEYIDGYPEDVPALNLTLDAPSYEAALEADAAVWSNVTEGQLYWIPGTRIDGAITLGSGGTYCPVLGLPHDYLAGPALDGTPLADCPEERPILDDFGHGTMTAARSVGEATSLCETCRLVSVEGTGAGPVRWAADAGWIDVQTNSWVSLVPAPVNQAQDEVPGVGGNDTTTDATAYAAERMATIFASGNGAAYLAGVAPTPTYTLSTAPPGVILVGAHDNGHIAPWSGSPPHVIADGYRGLAATNDSLDEVGPLRFTCCTSSSAPYAAGGAANIVQMARELLSDTTNGVEGGVVAEGDPGGISSGPLADGDLTLDELRQVLFRTAELPPTEGPHDGRMHWAGHPEDGEVDPMDPSGNPYCGGCWTVPIPYSELPSEVPTYAYTGYGSIGPASDAAALEVLAGTSELPEREQARQFYELDQSLRDALYG